MGTISLQNSHEVTSTLSKDDTSTSGSQGQRAAITSTPTLTATAKAGDPIPGGSPCYYLSASSTHSLHITNLTLTPRALTKSSRLTVNLTGNLTASAGSNCRIRFRASRLGGPSLTTSFRIAKNPHVRMTQGGAPTTCPESGDVQMEYVLNVPPVWLREGFYEVSASMWDSTGRVMTEFEAKVWMDDDRSWVDARGLMG